MQFLEKHETYRKPTCGNLENQTCRTWNCRIVAAGQSLRARALIMTLKKVTNNPASAHWMLPNPTKGCCQCAVGVVSAH